MGHIVLNVAGKRLRSFWRNIRQSVYFRAGSGFCLGRPRKEQVSLAALGLPFTPTWTIA
jgi:hypothetical protein